MPAMRVSLHFRQQSYSAKNTLHEMHSEEWLRRQLDYLSCCQRRQRGMLAPNTYEKPTPFPPFPNSKWFLAAYVQDVWSRMDVLLATATSSHGSILKVDSTKKICKKLQGADANTASWTTNVSIGESKKSIIIVCLLQVILKTSLLSHK